MYEEIEMTVAAALAPAIVAAYERRGWDLMAHETRSNRMTLWFARGLVLGE